MKSNLLTNLLIGTSLALCGLCSFQWLREAETRKDVRALLEQQQSLNQQAEEQNRTIELRDGRIDQLTGEVAALQQAVRTNHALVSQLRQEGADLASTNRLLSAQITSYVTAFQDATNRLATAYQDIKKQNAAVEELVAQRDQYVAKLNDSIRARNELTAQYNSLVEKVKAWQEQTKARLP